MSILRHRGGSRGGQRPLHTAFIAVLVLLALLALCTAASSARADATTVADPDVVEASTVETPVAASAYEAHLAKMSEEQLKKMLMDRSQGKKIKWKKYATREAVMEALLAEDREEMRRKAFLQRVERALDKQAKKPLRDDLHTVSVVYCEHTSYEPDVHRYEEAFFEKAARAKKAAALEKAKKDGDAPIQVTFTGAEKSLFLPNADHIKFTAEPYPLPKYNQVKSQVLSSLFMMTMGLSFMVGQLPFIPETIRNYLVQHRTLLVSTALMFNMFSGTAKRTGAFEVYVDGSLVYSHLAHGGTSTPLPSLVAMSELLTEKTLLAPYGV